MVWGGQINVHTEITKYIIYIYLSKSVYVLHDRDLNTYINGKQMVIVCVVITPSLGLQT